MSSSKSLIYRAFSPSGKSYIGKTKTSLHQRRLAHERCARNPNNPEYKYKFHNALRKYENQFIWEVLQDNLSEDDVLWYEIWFIDLFDARKNGYNMTFGGENPPSAAGTTWTIERKKKLAAKRFGNKNPYKGKLSLAQRQEILKLIASGHTHSQIAKIYSIDPSTVSYIRNKKWD